MRIKVINGNTTPEMTEDICKSAHFFSRPDTEIVCATPRIGPVTIEGFYDEYIAIQGVIEELLRSEREEKIDAYVVAAFTDPGIYALRELTQKPVVGIAESAIMLASFVAGKFSIVSVMPRIRMMLEELVRRVGLEHRVASIRTPNLKVEDFHQDIERCKKVLIQEAKAAVADDYAEAIVLGCAGMAEFSEEVAKEVDVPVFNAVASAIKIAEALVDMKMRTSKALSYMYPEKKLFKGLPELFQP